MKISWIKYKNDDILYDNKKHPELVATDENSKSVKWHKYVYKCNIKVPDNIAYYLTYERIKQVINDFWRSRNFVVKTGSRSASRHDIKAMTKILKLSNALLLGEAELKITQRKGKIDGQDKDICSSIILTSKELPKEILLANKTLDLIEDMIALWGYSLEEKGITISIDEKELMDDKRINKMFVEFSEFTLMSEYLKTYKQGVPVKDIII